MQVRNFKIFRKIKIKKIGKFYSKFFPGRILGVITFIMTTVKLGLTENLSFLRFYENQPGENESVYWILVFGMMLELAAIIRLSYLVTRINRRFRPLPAASSLSNLVPEISNPGLKYGFCKKYFDRNEPLTS